MKKVLLWVAIFCLLAPRAHAVQEYAKRFPTGTSLEVYTPTNKPPASSTTTDTSSFDDILSATEDTVQKALDVLDDGAVNVAGDTMTGALAINVSSATAFVVEDDGTKDDVFVVDTVNVCIGIGVAPDNELHIFTTNPTIEIQESTDNAQLSRLSFSGTGGSIYAQIIGDPNDFLKVDSIDSLILVTGDDVGDDMIFLVDAENIEAMRIFNNANITMSNILTVGQLTQGIGIFDGQLEVLGGGTLGAGGSDALIQAFSNTAFGTNVGGAIVFGGETDNSVDPYSFSGIQGTKFTGAGDNNWAGNLIFYTNKSDGNIIERMRIDGVGNVGTGTADPVSLSEVDGPIGLAIITVTGNTVLDNTHSTLLVNASGNVVVTLPTAASAFNSTDDIGRIYTVKKIDADADTVTLDGNGAEEIDGETTQVLIMQFQSLTIQSNGSSWSIL